MVTTTELISVPVLPNHSTRISKFGCPGPLSASISRVAKTRL